MEGARTAVGAGPRPARRCRTIARTIATGTVGDDWRSHALACPSVP